MKKIILFICILLALASFTYAVQIPTLNDYVTDKAGIFSSASKGELEKTLRELEKATNGVQYIIYIEKQYPKEYSLEEYSLKIAENNKIGKKGNDNGILLYVAIDDRDYRWEVGYGVESTLSASLLGKISREYLLPNFKEENYEKGITEAVNVTGRILLGSNDADIIRLKDNTTKTVVSASLTNTTLIFVIFMVLIFIVKIVARSRTSGMRSHKDDFYLGAATGLFLGRGRGGFGGSGGFGGGGGSFGGGGFSGKW
ncbi:TPM domain-containing protein [Candidatus Woesearchaeota archaeon]|nr:TPM domain-containing protein [Candidatus Woesearchaeota archaeon]